LVLVVLVYPDAVSVRRKFISVNSAFTSFRRDRPRSPAVLAPVAAGQLLKKLASLRLGVFALKPACTPAELR
jgi:hypothetical protein